jgi:EAL domain-containing protein (putative c-di-GMP-specific phosphodiesterase class I)/FixJ family two-component response regulator
VKILLVDDEPFTLRLLTHQLRELGHTEVTGCLQARDALARLEADPACAELVILDLQMPDIDGVEFIRHLARLHFGGGVILLSGEDERILHTAHRLARAHPLRVLGAVHKPVTPAQLHALLDAAAADPARGRRPAKRYSLEELREAIAAHQFVNWYQPKVEMATGAVVGVETLVRWQHPVDGLVFPDAFIPLAEEGGVVDALTRPTLERAVAQARAWRDAGMALQVGVNVSMDDLADLSFPDFVVGAIAAAGVSVQSLVLEVTESRLMRNAVAALDILTRLRLKHVGLSIDDFGTGHSSLAQLRDIPFDELKIDRSFIHGAVGNASSRAIVEASMGMAHHLGMRTVAEGVEDLDDWRLLRGMGCDLAQGYFIARPMPGEAVAGWLREWEARRPALVQGT